MKDVQEVIGHAIVLLLAALMGFIVWSTGDDAANASDQHQVEVWSGKPDQVERIAWEGKTDLTLEARKDAQGRWYVATVTKLQKVLKPDADNASMSKKADAPKEVTRRFISVTAAEPLIKGLAPLKAFRALGAYDESRAKEFGFDEPEGTLRVTIKNVERSLIVGGSTPGGGDRYARDPNTNTLYAVSGEIVHNLSRAEQRLFERDLHGFDVKEIDTLTVAFAGKTRTLTRVEGKTNSWADETAPTSVDETAGNWVNKLSRLTPQEYIEKAPPGLGPQSVVIRVRYYTGRRERGFLELLRVDGADGPEYLVRSEQTRSWFAEVLRSTGEQIEQDVASVVR